MRRAIELLSRGVVIKRRLPSMYGGCRLLVTPDCGLRYWVSVCADKPLLDNAAEVVRPGAVVWDVGANQGVFTFAAAGLAGPQGAIYAFEPDTVLVGLLRRSSKLNPSAAPVEVVPCAVSERLSLARFRVAARARAANSLEEVELCSTQTGGVREIQTVMTISLDWCLEQGFRLPNILKIDAEGADLQILRGAAELLRAARPVILIEVTITNVAITSKILLDLGYTMYDADVPADRRTPLPSATDNTLALPAS
jgi:FkbM family methyltransferase